MTAASRAQSTLVIGVPALSSSRYVLSALRPEREFNFKAPALSELSSERLAFSGCVNSPRSRIADRGPKVYGADRRPANRFLRADTAASISSVFQSRRRGGPSGLWSIDNARLVRDRRFS